MTAQSDIEKDPPDFWCPRCHMKQLNRSGGYLVCTECSANYPVVKETPVLINDDNSVFAINDYMDKEYYEGASYGSEVDSTKGIRGIYRKIAHRLSEFSIKGRHLYAETALSEFCSENIGRPRVLVIGAGTKRYPHPADFIYTDVTFGQDICAIADAHDLPFGNEEFDFVLVIAVLEHVADPQRVVSEIWRVLKPTGRVYAATPFLQPVHMGAYDFTRFTYLGHRRLFRRFSDISSGMALGPGAVASWTIRSLFVSVTASRRGRQVASFAGLVFGLPFKFVDYFTRRSPSAIDSAGGVYFYGKKQENAITDRDMIKLYRGGF
jgi:SAM-dependent methyltransferase